MQTSLFESELKYTITEELFQAYFDCRRNKRNTINALFFEKHFEHNLFQLEEEILSGSYEPVRSIAFIVNKPVKREIFAADFRDRVVQKSDLFQWDFIFLKIISLRWIINYIQSNLSKDQIKGLQEVVDYVDGFEDSFGLELLTTVDFALDECPEI